MLPSALFVCPLAVLTSFVVYLAPVALPIMLLFCFLNHPIPHPHALIPLQLRLELKSLAQALFFWLYEPTAAWTIYLDWPFEAEQTDEDKRDASILHLCGSSEIPH